MDGTALIIKNAGVAEGLSDLPWHIDCGMGGHSTICPVVQTSLFLEPANAETGTLKFLAGSHRFACHQPDPGQEKDLPVATVSAEPGDVAIHLSDTMHAAPAPRGAENMRRSLVTSFYQPGVLDMVPAGSALNDVLLSRDDGHVENLAELVSDYDK
jgi:ectoine hydroxylase-related dioxygenase (phytanoyl-CoA dioxygenase family)